MPNARTLVVPLAFGNPTLPVLYSEPLLTAGSLVLNDPTHPWGPWPTAAYASSSAVPNHAWQQAAAVVGSGDATALASSVTIEGGATNRLMEKTGKGALHVGWKPTATIGAQRVRMSPAALIASWIAAHANDHQFYACLSMRVTKNAGTSPRNSFGGATKNDSQSLWTFDTTGDLPPAGKTQRLFANRVGTANDGVEGVVFRSIAVSGIYSTFGTWGGTFDTVAQFASGRNSGWTAGSQVSPSSAVYFAYLEDLTVSGRTPATVDALAAARHNALFAAGGRYAGDTWTDPATIV